MRNNSVFTLGERKAAMWVVISAALVVAGGVAWDRVAGPSLGSYAGGYEAPAMPGVLDARPLS